jgi:GDP-4-dehydro-6-deoxy-D-mannose reductase
MRAVVTGAAGFVGRHLVAALRAGGHAVTALDRQGPADRIGDLATLSLRGLRPDAVFHLAAFANPSASVGAAEEAFAANVETTRRIVRDLPAGRFVIASSCAVYGPSSRAARETDPPAPGTPYAATKLCAEATALASGRDVVVLRPFNHTGPGQSDAYVCPKIARQVAAAELRGRPGVVHVADLGPRKDFFDVRDMVRAYLAAFERGRRGEIYNVGTAKPVSIRRIAETLASRSRVPMRVRGPERDRSRLSGDPSKFRRDTGWAPLIPLEATLGDLLDHERAEVQRRA